MIMTYTYFDKSKWKHGRGGWGVGLTPILTDLNGNMGGVAGGYYTVVWHKANTQSYLRPRISGIHVSLWNFLCSLV